MPENTFVLKLSNGADVLTELKKLGEEKQIDYGLIVSGTGSLKDMELISNEPKGGIASLRFDSPVEMHAISGKIQTRKGVVTVDVRVSVTGTGFTPKAGQLVHALASGSLEIGVRKVDLGKIIEA